MIENKSTRAPEASLVIVLTRRLEFKEIFERINLILTSCPLNNKKPISVEIFIKIICKQLLHLDKLVHQKYKIDVFCSGRVTRTVG